MPDQVVDLGSPLHDLVPTDDIDARNDKAVSGFPLSDFGYLDADTCGEVFVQTNLGRLVLGRKLGSGGFGVAYKATLDNEDVAVKKLHPGHTYQREVHCARCW